MPTYIGPDGHEWVRSKSGGISVFGSLDDPPVRGVVWRLPGGTPVSDRLAVINDSPNHWTLSPAVDMSFSEYIDALKLLEGQFTRN
jgi:hypothetical protein